MYQLDFFVARNQKMSLRCLSAYVRRLKKEKRVGIGTFAHYTCSKLCISSSAANVTMHIFFVVVINIMPKRMTAVRGWWLVFVVIVLCRLNIRRALWLWQLVWLKQLFYVNRMFPVLQFSMRVNPRVQQHYLYFMKMLLASTHEKVQDLIRHSMWCFLQNVRIQEIVDSGVSKCNQIAFLWTWEAHII